MVSTSSRVWLGACALLLAIGCQDVLGLTPGKPDSAAGSGGTAGSTLTTGGSATGGGSTGGSAGSATDECAMTCKAASICDEAKCVGPICTITHKAKGEPAGDAKQGDCLADVCDGNGASITAFADDGDDGNDCTWDACAAGVAGHLPKRDGAHCKDKNGAGVCEVGQCKTGACGAANGMKDGNETGVDCGGSCPACADSAGCRVSEDCQSGFCASGACAQQVALAVASKPTGMSFAAHRAGVDPPWVSGDDPGMLAGLTAAGIAFDAAGEAVAVTRASTSGARTARWKPGAWTTAALWPLSSGSWMPAFAKTDAALYFFAVDANSQHQFAAAMGNTGGAFAPVGDANGAISGSAATRQGHASYFYSSVPDGGSVVEVRFVGGVWSPPVVVLSGNYADAPPAVTDTALGTLVVAARRMAGEHSFDWALFDGKSPPKSGTIPATDFPVGKPLPKRIALAPLADGSGAMLAFRNAGNTLDVRVGADDKAGGLTWSAVSIYPASPTLTAEPVVARGLGEAKVELLWITNPGTVVQHSSWLGGSMWTAAFNVTTSGYTSVAVATP